MMNHPPATGHTSEKTTEKTTEKTSEKRLTRAQREVVAAEKVARALGLRKMGVTYEVIARECGYADRSAARKAVAHALDAMKVNAAEADALRALEGERLDDLYRAAIQPALRGDLPAIDRVLKIMERRARLFGLDLQGVLDPNAGVDRSVTITIVRREVTLPPAGGPSSPSAAASASPSAGAQPIVDALVVEGHDDGE